MQGVSARLTEWLSKLTFVLLEPTSNLRAAFLLYGSIVLILLILLVIAIMIVMASTKDDEAPELRGWVEAGTGSRGPRVPRAKPAKAPMEPRARAAVGAGILLALVVAWAIAGYTTSSPALCKNCHWPGADHARAPAGTDPHANVSCISCHESGKTVGRYLANVPARLIHFANSQSSASRQGEYGHVTVAACASCHEAALAGVATNKTRGLKISHKEPLAASATCLDCHVMRAGVVGPHNAGMSPCLRCHDAKRASAECAMCHDQKAASAARARTASFAEVQIPDVSCGGCHDQTQQCDWCHGMRLPHSAEFKAYAHARAGAVDFWFNGGKACSRCHTASRRPCQSCHGSLLGHGHGTGAAWLASGHQTAAVQACNTCHQRFAYSATRDFCKDLCHTHAAIEGSPR